MYWWLGFNAGQPCGCQEHPKVSRSLPGWLLWSPSPQLSAGWCMAQVHRGSIPAENGKPSHWRLFAQVGFPAISRWPVSVACIGWCNRCSCLWDPGRMSSITFVEVCLDWGQQKYPDPMRAVAFLSKLKMHQSIFIKVWGSCFLSWTDIGLFKIWCE